uniref:Uncharacterized protein LOC104239104 n=1 Tax=Nicotiana sylvestris TaxID=4096 RepID=A0A1U7XQN4_NICSY|nr:PREDICTED: uncharacterized protein LOC104239104 [Nicotiana sylvestris]
MAANEICDNFQDIHLSDKSRSASLKIKCNPFGTAWVYRDENRKLFLEKQLSEDDITGQLQIPRKLAHYLQSPELQSADLDEQECQVELVRNMEEDEYYMTGEWENFVQEHQLKPKDLVVIEISDNQRLRVDYISDHRAIDNHVLVRRLSRAEVKDLYLRKLSENYSYCGTGLIEIQPVVEMKLCSENADSVKLILPKKEVEENLNDLPLPAVGGEIPLTLFDPVGNNIVEMKLVHGSEEDGYYIGGGEWKEYAVKHNLLTSDTLFLDKVIVHNDEHELNNHYEITYQRGSSKEREKLDAAAATTTVVIGDNKKGDDQSEYEGDLESFWLWLV